MHHEDMITDEMSLAELDTVMGAGNDIVLGEAGSDILVGNEGSNPSPAQIRLTIRHTI